MGAAILYFYVVVLTISQISDAWKFSEKILPKITGFYEYVD